MSVLTQTPPAACVAAFINQLPAFLPGGAPGSVVSETWIGGAPHIPTPAGVGMGSGPTLGPPNIPAVLEAFVLSLADAASNAVTISPARAGWRFFAGGAPDKTVMGRVIRRPSRQAWKLIAVNYGDVVWRTLEVALQLELLSPPQIPAGDYELRLLAINGLNLGAFWLAAQTAGSVDLIFPTPSAQTGGSTIGYGTTLLPLPNFLAAIRQQAAGLLTMPAGYGA
jgi:hypothetical protein